METISWVIASYLWGSLSPAYLVARTVRGIDLRRYGSGTVGGSNVGEQVGFAWMIIVGLADLLKGFGPTMLARVARHDLALTVVAGLATVCGHNWSLYLGFKGGRGVGTTMGALCALDARLALGFLIILAIAKPFKQGAPATAIALGLLAPIATLLDDALEIVVGGALFAFIAAIKRIEANRLPLPREPREKWRVLLRRLWMDRDVPTNQLWERRGRIE